MAHVSSQKWQFCLNIETAAVPAHENVHCEAEAEVMMRGNLPSGFLIPARLKSMCRVSLSCVPLKQGSIVWQAVANRFVLLQECFDLHPDIAWQRQDARFVKLGGVDRKRLTFEAVVESQNQRSRRGGRISQ
jgi:hypothetical protein